MRKLWILAIALLMSLGACGGGGDPTPAEQCEDGAVAICSRFYECFSAAELAQLQFPATEAECVTEQSVDCATTTADNYCDVGDTFHSDQVDPCLSGLTSASCADITSFNFPAACNLICQTP